MSKEQIGAIMNRKPFHVRLEQRLSLLEAANPIQELLGGDA